MAKIHQALQKVNDELGAIKKDQSGFNYKFRGIYQVMNAISPLFKKHGIVVRRENVVITQDPQVRDVKGKPTIMNRCLLIADYVFVSTEDGSELSSSGFGEGEDKGDKAVGCATSNAYKYVIFEMFNIPTEDQEDSDMKTAREEGVTGVKAPAKTGTKEVAKPKAAGFRKKKVETSGEL